MAKNNANNLKLDVYPNLYSIIALFASVLVLVVTALPFSEIVARCSVGIIVIASLVVYCAVKRNVKKRIEAKKELKELRKLVSKCGRISGYLSYFVFALSALIPFCKNY